MQKDEIFTAIELARKGIGQYLAIMERFPSVDVSVDKTFQRQFNAFYRIRQRPERWYSEYYSFMESGKDDHVRFEVVIDHIHGVLGRYEPSFSSKLAATLDPNEPVWDKYVLHNTNQKAPYYTAANKLERAKTVFGNIRKWYVTTLQSAEGRVIIEIFNNVVREHERITDIKKIDFVLWKTRG
ncbi:MAG: hypothetical protein A4E65_01479 [Syntrophorhabdus sp. PtaU1.Bin153]|nr:MAG: hypothetical protein A4E65_01479 [Syntrophorhabdus sp. PtaU1.Bin153]